MRGAGDNLPSITQKRTLISPSMPILKEKSKRAKAVDRLKHWAMGITQDEDFYVIFKV